MTAMRKPVDAAPAAGQLAAHGVEVEERLAGVFVGAVAAVHHRHPRRRGELGHRAVGRVAHHDHVAVAGQHPRRVVQRLALGQRRRPHAGGLAHIAAKQIERRTERHAGARARLEEHVGEDGALQHAGDAPPIGVGQHLVGHSEHPLDVLALELIDR